jgi:ribbon-helix-helix CopG family protein
MSHRTQITLTDEQYLLLKRESKRTGRSLSGLVRRAIDTAYRRRGRRYDEEAWEESFGLWRDRHFDSLEYLKRIRGPGLGYKLLGEDPPR